MKVMFGLVTSAASAAAAIVYVAHYGNPNANWFPFCQQYNYFCGRVSGSLIGSFIAVVVFIMLILMSGISISRNWNGCHGIVVVWCVNSLNSDMCLPSFLCCAQIILGFGIDEIICIFHFIFTKCCKKVKSKTVHLWIK